MPVSVVFTEICSAEIYLMKPLSSQSLSTHSFFHLKTQNKHLWTQNLLLKESLQRKLVFIFLQENSPKKPLKRFFLCRQDLKCNLRGQRSQLLPQRWELFDIMTSNVFFFPPPSVSLWPKRHRSVSGSSAGTSDHPFEFNNEMTRDSHSKAEPTRHHAGCATDTAAASYQRWRLAGRQRERRIAVNTEREESEWRTGEKDKYRENRR